MDERWIFRALAFVRLLVILMISATIDGNPFVVGIVATTLFIEIAVYEAYPANLVTSEGNILEYELYLSAGDSNEVVSKGSFSGNREKQYIIFERPSNGQIVTLKILNAVGNVTSMSGFKLVHP